MSFRRILFAGLFMVGVCQGAERAFQSTFKVVDDEQRPVSGAKIQVSWTNAKASKPSERIQSADGITGQDGCVTLKGKTLDSAISYGADKEGHYVVWGQRYHFKAGDLSRWQPWNPTIDVVLKRKKNPVPMYAKRVEVKVPEFDQPIGYDLVIGDWVAPYGKGRAVDLVFTANRKIVSGDEYDGTLTLSFAHEGDGLLAYEAAQPDLPGLKMPYEAPEEDYLPSKTWRERRYIAEDGTKRVQSSASPRMNYFMRVRTVRDKGGRIISALYGKVHGDFRWFIGARAPRSGLAFEYYLNPDGTRNIEFDPKRNLLNPAGKDLPEFRSLEP